MEMAHEFTFTAELNEAVPVGPGPFGTRRIREVLGGEVTGERIHGRVGTGGADWVLVGPDGWGRLDVRLTIRSFAEAVDSCALVVAISAFSSARVRRSS